MTLLKMLGETLIFAGLTGFLWPIITAFFGSKGVVARFVAKLPSLKDALLRLTMSTRDQIVAGYAGSFVRRAIIASLAVIAGISITLVF